MKRIFRSFSGILACSALLVFMACGEDSSSAPETEDAILSSSSETIDTPEPPVEGDTPPTSSDEITDTTPDISTPEGPAPETPSTFNFEKDAEGFVDIGAVYQALSPSDKVAFIIRHAEREDSLGQLSDLTPAGVLDAQKVGEKLKGDEAFYYASTDFVRTRKTCQNIAIGRGEGDVEVVTWDGINGDYFIATSQDEFDKFANVRGGSWKVMSRWAFQDPSLPENQAAAINAHFYDLMERGDQFINEVILPNMPNWNRVSILATHDVLAFALLVYATNRTIDLRFYDNGKWVNYLSGIAVVQHEDSSVEIIPIRGMDVGFMNAKKSS